jgi:hypothetical protein
MARFGALAFAFAFTATFSAGAALGASAAKREREAKVRSRDSVFMGVGITEPKWMTESMTDDCIDDRGPNGGLR